MPTAELLREKLRKAIAAKIKREGLSQSQAGERCGGDRIFMNHLVKGRASVSISRLIEIAESLGLKVDLTIEDRRQEK